MRIGDAPGGLFQQPDILYSQRQLAGGWAARRLLLRDDANLDTANLAVALPPALLPPSPNQLRFLEAQAGGPGRAVGEQAQTAVADAGDLAVFRQFLGQAGPDLALDTRQPSGLERQPGGVGNANLLKNFGYRS